MHGTDQPLRQRVCRTTSKERLEVQPNPVPKALWNCRVLLYSQPWLRQGRTRHFDPRHVEHHQLAPHISLCSQRLDAAKLFAFSLWGCDGTDNISNNVSPQCDPFAVTIWLRLEETGTAIPNPTQLSTYTSSGAIVSRLTKPSSPRSNFASRTAKECVLLLSLSPSALLLFQPRPLTPASMTTLVSSPHLDH